MTETSPPPQIEVLAFAGSLRKNSYNKALLRATKALAPEKISMEIYNIGDIPLFNQDVEEQGDPPPVTHLKQAIDRADTLLIATPEYNYGVPGVTKNAVDWASRPPKKSVLAQKPVGVMGASPSITGTARGQSQLRQAFGYTNSFCLPQPEILVFQAHKKFDEEGKLADDQTREFLQDYLEALYNWTRKFVKK